MEESLLLKPGKKLTRLSFNTSNTKSIKEKNYLLSKLYAPDNANTVS